MGGDMSEDELERLLSEWYKLKESLKKYEEQEDKIKELIHREMNDKDVNKLESDHFVCKRTSATREYLNKCDVPRDVWDRYKKTTTFKTLTLKMLKN